MEYRTLGAAGVRVSTVGIGCNDFGRRCDFADTLAIIDRALDLGVNHLDTADIYCEGRSEEFIGKALAGRRHQVVIASKTGMRLGGGPHDVGLSYSRVLSCCEASLRRLGSDRQARSWGSSPSSVSMRTTTPSLM